MSEQSIADQLQARFGDAIRDGDPDAIDQWIEVDADCLAEVCKMLRDEENIQLDMLNCITLPLSNGADGPKDFHPGKLRSKGLKVPE